MTEQEGRGIDLVSQPREARAAEILRQAIIAGKMSTAGLALFADAFQAAGWKVDVPHPDGGFIRTRRKKCGATKCRCAAPGAKGHGPYAYRYYRDAWGQKKRQYLGRVRAPGDAPKPSLRPATERLPNGRLPAGVIHGD